MAHPRMFDEGDPVLGRVRAIALAFPDAAEKVAHGQPAFHTTKVFAYYGGSEKLPSGGHVRHDASLLVSAPTDERPALLQDERFFSPMYLGPAGWVGLRLDGATDWTEVRELIDASYRRTAGVRRVQRLDRGGPV